MAQISKNKGCKQKKYVNILLQYKKRSDLMKKDTVITEIIVRENKVGILWVGN